MGFKRVRFAVSMSAKAPFFFFLSLGFSVFSFGLAVSVSGPDFWIVSAACFFSFSFGFGFSYSQATQAPPSLGNWNDFKPGKRNTESLSANHIPRLSLGISSFFFLASFSLRKVSAGGTIRKTNRSLLDEKMALCAR